MPESDTLLASYEYSLCSFIMGNRISMVAEMFVFTVSASVFQNFNLHQISNLHTRRSNKVGAELYLVTCKFNVAGSRHNAPR